MSCKTFHRIRPLVEAEYGMKTEEIFRRAESEYDRLCRENQGENKAVRARTREDLYPCVALYRSLEQSGVDKPAALQFLDRSWSALAQPKADSMRAMLKVPGLYRLMPRIFRWVTVRQFGEAAGFRATFYPTGGDRCRFDMTRCLYCDLCRKNGCPELTVCFCHTDDVTNAHMHPRILWHRTQIMGDGGSVCDFDLSIRPK